MKREKRKPPKIYWIRVAVDAEISCPSAYVGALVDEIREGIHTQHAVHMSESSLLAMIEGAIHAEISDKKDKVDGEIDKGLLNDIEDGEEGEEE